MGGTYVNDFLNNGRVKRVYMQADAPFRMSPEDFKLWSVRNDQGQMVPFTAFANSHWSYGSPRLERYNGVSAVEIQGEAAPGVSTSTEEPNARAACRAATSSSRSRSRASTSRAGAAIR